MNRLIIMLSLLMFVGVNYAQEYTKVTDYKAIEKKIVEKNSGVNSLQADFTQEKHMSILNQPFVSKGLFYYKKPNQVRWEYTTPFSYIVVLKENKVSIKDGDDLQNYDMSKNAIFNEINKVMSGIVNGEMLRDDNFDKIIYSNKDSYKVALTPQENKVKDFVEEIHLTFDKSSLLMKSITMLEKGGDKTTINLNNVKSNESVSDVVFEKI